jgi:hypothetical protein
VCYHLRTLGVPARTELAQRFDWAAIASYYADGHYMHECRRRFGFSRAAWYQAVERGEITLRDRREPLESLLSDGRPRNRFHVKWRLLDAGLKDNRCEACGIAEWCGRPLAMALHHVNGENSDNRLDNLVFLCPNCHSQTENFAGRKNRRATA